MSTHTHPSPAATEKGDPGNRIRATIAPSFSAKADDVLVDFGGFAEVLVVFGGSPVVVQPDAVTATPTAITAASLNEIGART